MTEQTKKRQRTLSAFVGKAEPHSVHWSESSSLLTYNLLGELLPLVLSNAAPLRVAAFDLVGSRGVAASIDLGLASMCSAGSLRLVIRPF